MEPLSVATLGLGSLFLRSLIKLGGDTIQDVKGSVASLLASSLTDALAEDGPGALREVLASLKLSKTALRPHDATYMVVDLAGVAWAQLVLTTSPELLERTFVERDAHKIVRQLPPSWFVDTLLDSAVPSDSLAVDVATGELPPQTVTALSATLGRSIAQALRLDLPLDSSALEDILRRLPSRIESLLGQMPTLVSKHTQLAAESAAYHSSGKADEEKLSLAMTQLAERLVAQLSADVFGRKTANPEEPPLLMLHATYVEPQATTKQVNHQGLPEKGSAIALALAGIAKQSGLCVLSAPFGYGKSLTFKMIAAQLAKEWQVDKANRPYPLLLRCPELIAGRAPSLEAAIQTQLSRETGLLSSASERIWDHRLVVLLDGFDEVQLTAREAEEWLRDMDALSSTRHIRLLIASRPHAFHDSWLKPNATLIKLLPFDKSLSQEWLDKNSPTILGRRIKLGELTSRLDEEDAGIPILLLMALHGWTRNELPPKNKAEVYRRFIERISLGKWAAVQDPHPVVNRGASLLLRTPIQKANAFQLALEILAWRALVKAQNSDDERAPENLTRKEIEQSLLLHFPEIKTTDIDAVTHSLCLSLFLHKGSDDESVVFSHRSFREFLSAQHLAAALLAAPTVPMQSAAWRLLAEASLGEAESNFVLQILELDSSDAIEPLASRLQQLSDETGLVVVSEDGFRWTTTDLGRQVLISSRERDNGSVVRANARLLERKLRRVKTNWYDNAFAPGADHVSPLGDLGRWRPIALMQPPDKHRVPTYAYVYNKINGRTAFASPIKERARYEECLGRDPDLFLQIIDASETHFFTGDVDSTIRLNIFGLDDSDFIQQSLNLVRLAQRSKRAGIGLSHRIADTIARTKDGPKFGTVVVDDKHAGRVGDALIRSILISHLSRFVYERKQGQVMEGLVAGSVSMLCSSESVDYDQLLRNVEQMAGLPHRERAVEGTGPEESDD